MAQIKIKNASSCIRCRRYMNCDVSKEYASVVHKLQKIADNDNSLNASISIKCKKEC